MDGKQDYFSGSGNPGRKHFHAKSCLLYTSEFHEDPWVSFVSEENTGVLMVPGMMFTIEPMVNMGSDEIYTDEIYEWTVRTEDGLLSLIHILAYSLVFSHHDQTLEESEITAAMKKILNGLTDLGIELRS